MAVFSAMKTTSKTITDKSSYGNEHAGFGTGIEMVVLAVWYALTTQ